MTRGGAADLALAIQLWTQLAEMRSRRLKVAHHFSSTITHCHPLETATTFLVSLRTLGFNSFFSELG
jgi:hypothetical protein